MIERQTGIDLVHVPYTGVAPGMNDRAGRQRSRCLCGPITLALPFIKAGSVKRLALPDRRRLAAAAGVASAVQRYPGVISAWFGLFAPAGTPAADRAQLHDEFKKLFSDAGTRAPAERSLGVDPAMDVRPQFSKLDADEAAKWAKV